MIDVASIQARDSLRAEHDQLIADFLDRGGHIEQLAHVERAPIRQAVWNGGITHNEDNRRAFLELERQIAEHGRALAATGLTVEQAVRQLRKRWVSLCSRIVLWKTRYPARSFLRLLFSL